ncbi:exocyst complex component 6-like isoform X5 [Tachypleus tridentatus]|uniref:exocyst complex component 6-like isoform X5 n=1 Tax=Tachypleus tridentatus TaxID=6853 RepID=UPI003FD296FC
MKIPRGLNRKIVELITSQAYYQCLLTMFANSEPVRGFEEGALQMCFADLRQLLDLFMTWDWSTYFHDYGQENSKYLRVNPQVAVVLLEKYDVRKMDFVLSVGRARQSNQLSE